MDGATLLPEFDQEMANTRKMLERVPEAHFDFKPHEKSYSLLELAAHVANVPTWTGVTLTATEFDLAEPWRREPPDSTDGLLAEFDAVVADARNALESATADDMEVGWSLKMGDEVYFTLPRRVVLRTYVMNHIVHHRAQLGVYLRLLDVPVPGMYGPSADEAM